MIRTRLDAVVEVKEREEDKAATVLARAEVAAQAASQKAVEARQLAMRDFRARNDIAQWEMMELAHHRALSEARKAEKEAERLRQAATTARTGYTVAHQKAEVVRRVADHRREEAAAALNRAEDKENDDAATLMFSRKAG
jgi:flagellar biosynthesis chaperone FliJ